MSAQSLSPWIADFIQEEIKAVLAWQTNQYNNIKVEDEGRFDNDGSNLRSVVAQPKPGRCEVQLIEVFGAPDPSGIKVVISDGHTQCKAWLSGSVIDILEAELDEKLGIETTNDVFRLTRFVVISTSIGPEDEWIQLTVEEIEYLHHRRRTIGQPTPIEQNSHLRSLITDDVTNLLERHLVTEAGKHDLQSQYLQSDVEAGSIAVQRSSPLVSRPLESAPEKVAQGLRKKPQLRHTLETDGFEVQAGVNLQRPVEASRSDRLLRLLTKSEHQPKVIAETPARRFNRAESVRGRGFFAGAAVAGAEANGAESTETSPEPMDIDNSPRRSQLQRSSPHHRAISQSNAHQFETQVPQRPAPPSPVRPSTPQLSIEQLKYPLASTRFARTGLHDQPKCVRTTRVKPRIPYGRRKIPANQQALLEAEISWLPSLPGRSFPKPNVPIELLTKWNTAPSPSQKATAASSRASALPSQATRPCHPSHRKSASSERDLSSSMSISEKSDDSDEMVASSEWPASQSTPRSRPQARPDVPPDSSPDGNVVRGTPEELEIEPPRVLKGHNFTQRAAIQRDNPSLHLSGERHGSNAMRRATANQQGIPKRAMPAQPAGLIPGDIHAMPSSQQSTSTHGSPHVQPQVQQYTRIAQTNAPSSPTSSKRGTISPGPHHSAKFNGQRTTVLPVAPCAGSLTQPSRGGTPRVSIRADQVVHRPHGAPATPIPLPPRGYASHSRREWLEQHHKQDERLKAEQANAENQMMREFVSSYINIRPGGAFATGDDVRQPQRHRPVNVLAWDEL